MADQASTDTAQDRQTPPDADNRNPEVNVEHTLDQLAAGLTESAGATIPMDRASLSALSSQAGDLSTGGRGPEDDLCGDVSIEEYMAALLARCRGDAGGGTAELTSGSTSSTAPGRVTPPSARTSSSSNTAGGQADSVRSSAVRPPQESNSSPTASQPTPVPTEPPQRKRQAPPERRETLDNMRDVANMSTRTSLSAHVGRALIAEMHNRLMVTMVLLVTSFALVGFTTTVHSLTYIGAIVALVASAVWTVRCVRIARRLDQVVDEVQLTGEPLADGDGA